MELVINLQEWDKCQLQLLEQWMLFCLDSWQDLKKKYQYAERKKKEVLIVACSDEGIGKAKEANLPVVALRNEYYEERYGTQELFGAPVLLEKAEDLDENLAKQVWNRYYEIPLVIGETDRCRIREIGKADIRKLYEITEGVVNEGALHSLFLNGEDFREFWEAYIKQQYGFFGYGLWLIETKNQELIGLMGFQNVTEYEEMEEVTGDCVEMSYWIAPESRRQGFAGEAGRFLLDHIVPGFEWSEVILFIKEENIASQRLAKSLGFSFTRRKMAGHMEIQCWKMEAALQFFEEEAV